MTHDAVKATCKSKPKLFSLSSKTSSLGEPVLLVHVVKPMPLESHKPTMIGDNFQNPFMAFYGKKKWGGLYMFILGTSTRQIVAEGHYLASPFFTEIPTTSAERVSTQQLGCAHAKPHVSAASPRNLSPKHQKTRGETW